ncbi:MAG: hypothetical protein FJW36_15470 [Acidobacteria bacterium]|nr:hypothetical protein [Acidobacteriota bacterium]
MRNLLVLTVFATLTAQMSFAEVLEHPRNLKEEARIQEKAQKRWMWSAIALTAASFADVHSSWGKREANSLLRSNDGTFGGKGLAIKMSMVGGILLGQHVMVSKSPSIAKALTFTNYGMAGMKIGVAARNYQIEKPKYLLRQQ